MKDFFDNPEIDEDDYPWVGDPQYDWSDVLEFSLNDIEGTISSSRSRIRNLIPLFNYAPDEYQQRLKEILEGSPFEELLEGTPFVSEDTSLSCADGQCEEEQDLDDEIAEGRTGEATEAAYLLRQDSEDPEVTKTSRSTEMMNMDKLVCSVWLAGSVILTIMGVVLGIHAVVDDQLIFLVPAGLSAFAAVAAGWIGIYDWFNQPSH